MKKTLVVLALVAVTTVVTAHAGGKSKPKSQIAPKLGEKLPNGSLVVDRFPNGTKPFGTYVITAADANLYIKRLYLPKAFTIKVAPDVRSVEWTVDTLEFGNRVVIDLDNSQAAPPAPPQAGAWGQAAQCDQGAGGAKGATGAPGVNGVSLTLVVRKAFIPKGSLWIRSDGSTGGKGATGQPGQQGGGDKHVFPFNIYVCGSAAGGPGGPGGDPGPGGMPGSIKVLLGPEATVLPVGGPQPCGFSTRPSAANIDTGVVVVSSAPGCPGQPGDTGAPGAHG